MTEKHYNEVNTSTCGHGRVIYTNHDIIPDHEVQLHWDDNSVCWGEHWNHAPKLKKKIMRWEAEHPEGLPKPEAPEEKKSKKKSSLISPGISVWEADESKSE